MSPVTNRPPISALQSIAVSFGDSKNINARSNAIAVGIVLIALHLNQPETRPATMPTTAATTAVANANCSTPWADESPG